MIQVIDNAVSVEDHQRIESTLLNANFPWFYNTNKVGKQFEDHLHNFQFTHKFYADYAVQSAFMSLIEPILVKLNPSALVRIKANLNTVTEHMIVYEMHRDFESFDGWTAIYYVNTNNGYTVFENGKRVDSVANRLVVFPATLSHAGTSTTDQKVRSVINFNFYKWTK